MGFPGAPLRLLVRDFLPLSPQLRHDAPNEGRGIIQLPQHVQKAFVIQSKPGKMLNLIHCGELLDNLVIHRPQFVHHRAFPAAGLDAADDLIALFPIFQEGGDHLHRILKIRTDRDRAIPAGLAQTIIGAVELPKVLDVEDRLDFRVRCADFPQQRPGLIRGTVVNAENLVLILGKRFHLSRHGLRDRFDVLFLVVAGNHDADLFLPGGFHEPTALHPECSYPL